MKNRTIIGDLNEVKKKGIEHILENDFWPLNGEH